MLTSRFKRHARRFWQLFWSAGEVEEPIVAVVRAASVDPQIKSSLFMILRMDSNQRKTAVYSLVTRLRAQQAPDGLVAALSYLEDDDFAQATLKVLENDL